MDNRVEKPDQHNDRKSCGLGRKIPVHVCKSLKDAFVYDGYGAHKDNFRYRYLLDLFFEPAYSAVVFFRIQVYLFSKYALLKNKAKRSFIDKVRGKCYYNFMLLFASINYKINAGFEPSPLADVSPGLYIHHCQGVILGGDTRIGSNCHIFKNVLLGEKNGIYPTIKDNVTLYANSVVIGKATLHNNAVVAPNSVVITDVAENTIVAGIPAKPIGENKYIIIQEEGIPLRVLRSGIKNVK